MVESYFRTGSYIKAGKECGVRGTTIKAAVESSGAEPHTAFQLRAAGLKRCAMCKVVFPRTEEFFCGLEKTSYCRPCARIRATRLKTSTVNGVLGVRFSKAKKRAKAFSLPFTLTIEQLRKKWEDQRGLCFYTGRPMTFGGSPKKWAFKLTTVSIDRIKPELGYTDENTVLCCMAVNRMKADMTIEEMRDWSKAICEFGGI